MDVALVSVGDELLSGDTVNTNAAWLGERLSDRGSSVERVTVVPDRIADIARVINEYAAEHDAVVVTGGLGPTHDDVTMDAVAAAVGRPLETSEAALEWLAEEGGYRREDLTEGTGRRSRRSPTPTQHGRGRPRMCRREHLRPPRRPRRDWRRCSSRSPRSSTGGGGTSSR